MRWFICTSILGIWGGLVFDNCLQPAEPTLPSRHRGLIVEAVRNPFPAFMVRVDVDRPDRTYRAGELVHVKVVSEKAGYLYLFYINAEGYLQCVFPNRFQSNNQIPARRQVDIPAPDAPFQFRVGPPFGREVLKAVVTLQPIEPQQWGVKSLTELDATPLDPDQAKRVLDALQKTPGQWAEHEVYLLTMPADKVSKPEKPQRIGVFVGFSRYQDPNIREVRVGDRDAKAMADLMQRVGQLDKAIVLVNEQATLAALEKLICTQLPELSRPGDEIFLFWSGHGGRCADQNGDERDGLDEYLVPYDGRIGTLSQIQASMLLDDTFGRWIQRLDGRRIVLILDACYAAGQAAVAAKGVRSPEPLPPPSDHFDFLDGELVRTKDVGQKETAMLVACQADQVAFIRRQDDFSVMTYYLYHYLLTSTKPVSLQDAYEYLKDAVPKYVKENFAGGVQTPELINNMSTPVYLRP